MIPRMSSENLSVLAKDIATNSVFLSTMIREHDAANVLHMVFMPLALGCLSDLSKEEAEDIGLIYEYLKEAGPRGINGYPMFTSCRFLTKKDTEIVFEKAKRIIKAMEEASK